MSLADRVRYPDFLQRTMTAEQAAALIPAGANVGMSGFTGAGYPKAVPLALAARIENEHAQGHPFRISVWTGASTAPELDVRWPRSMALKCVCRFSLTPFAATKSTVVRCSSATCTCRT